MPFVMPREPRTESAPHTHSRPGRDAGLGLGLSIVLEIVKLHHGVIEAHSDGDGGGTTMRVRVPFAGGN